MNEYPVPTPTTTLREVITPTPNILKMKVFPVLHLCHPTPTTYLTHQMKKLEDASWGPKVSHPGYVDFNSDEDDVLGVMIYLLTILVMKTMMNLLIIVLIKMKKMTMIRHRLSV